jgi:hypothetical protein|tara:strand:+ start:453 stop:578 length:126 start_codon:yes stop_codon:yes gene_type:complete
VATIADAGGRDGDSRGDVRRFGDVVCMVDGSHNLSNLFRAS